MFDVRLSVSPHAWWASTDEGPERSVASVALRDPTSEEAEAFRHGLDVLETLAHEPVGLEMLHRDPAIRRHVDHLDRLAVTVGGVLAEVLSEDERAQLAHALSQPGDDELPLLRIRVAPRKPTSACIAAADRVLALPWELIHIGGRFPVADGVLDVVREALIDRPAISCAPASALRVVVHVAAPVDQASLDYDDETWRIWQALGEQADTLMLTDRGTLDDLLDTVADSAPNAVHFSGHGAPGALIFEDDAALGQPVLADALAARMLDAISRVGPQGDARSAPMMRLPRLVYLAACHGTSSGESVEVGTPPGPEAGRLPSESRSASASALHRAGFEQVIAYSGPVDDRQSTRIEQAIYTVLAAGRPVREAIRVARDVAMRPLATRPGERVVFPLAWSRIAFFHRGTHHPIAVPMDAVEPATVAAPRHGSQRRISLRGRRAERAELIRRWRSGERHLVVAGLGGIGKTALCTDVLESLAKAQGGDEAAPILVLNGRHCRDTKGSIDALWRDLERFRPLDREWSPGAWASFLREMRRDGATADALLGAVRVLAEEHGGLLVYLDDAESLQASVDQGSVAEWRDAEARRLWAGLVDQCREAGSFGLIASTRYAPDGTADAAVIHLGQLRPLDVYRWLRWLPALGHLEAADAEWVVRRVQGRPRSVVLLETLAHQRVRARLGELGEDADDLDWRTDILHPLIGEVDQRVETDLLLGQLWDGLSPGEREHLGRATVLLGAVPEHVIVALGSIASARSLARMGLLSPTHAAGDARPWWSPHPLVRAMAAERWTGKTDIVHSLVALALLRDVEPGDVARWVLAARHLLIARDPRAWPVVRTAAGLAGHGTAMPLFEQFIDVTDSPFHRAVAQVERCRLGHERGESPVRHTDVLTSAADALPPGDAYLHAVVDGLTTLLDAGRPMEVVRAARDLVSRWSDIEPHVDPAAVGAWKLALHSLLYGTLPDMGYMEEAKAYAPDLSRVFAPAGLREAAHDSDLPASFWSPRVVSPRTWLVMEPRLAPELLDFQWWPASPQAVEQAQQAAGVQLSDLANIFETMSGVAELAPCREALASLGSAGSISPVRMLDIATGLMEQACLQSRWLDQRFGTTTRWREARTRIGWIGGVIKRLNMCRDDPTARALERQVSTRLGELFIVQTSAGSNGTYDSAHLRHEHGRLLLLTEAWSDALQEFDQSRDILRHHFESPDHPDIAASLHESAYALFRLGRVDDALERLTRAADALTRTFGGRSTRLLFSSLDRAAILHTSGDPAAARIEVQHCRDVAERAQHPSYLVEEFDAWLGAHP